MASKRRSRPPRSAGEVVGKKKSSKKPSPPEEDAQGEIVEEAAAAAAEEEETPGGEVADAEEAEVSDAEEAEEEDESYEADAEEEEKEADAEEEEAAADDAEEEEAAADAEEEDEAAQRGRDTLLLLARTASPSKPKRAKPATKTAGSPKPKRAKPATKTAGSPKPKRANAAAETAGSPKTNKSKPAAETAGSPKSNKAKPPPAVEAEAETAGAPRPKRAKPAAETAVASRPAASTKEKKPKRTWSTEDELRILEAMAARDEPVDDDFYSTLAGLVNVTDCDGRVVKEKIRTMQRRFNHDTIRGVVPTEENHRRFHELGKTIWGSTAAKAKAKATEEVADGATGNNTQDLEGIRERYPFLAAEVMLLEPPERSILNRALLQMPDSKASLLDNMIRKFRFTKLRLDAEWCKIKRELDRVAMELIR